ncbi:MAG TPA: alpha/beta fold hydrolase [Candidatus Xenobia bacterium]|jgi:pimeloyl-ACP methyl ester carboxylesterase
MLPEVTTVQPDPGLPPVEYIRIGDGPGRVVILPGNPGSARFYLPFMTSLHERLGAEVIALSYPGHEFRQPSSRCLSLDETIQWARGFLQQCPGPLAVVGHSIGAHIAMQALSDRSIPIIATFPFLQFTGASRRQRMLHWMVWHLGPVRAVVAAHRLLVPDTVKRRWGRRDFRHEAALAAAIDVLRDASVKATLTLARHEFADLARPFELPRPFLQVLCAEADHWFPTAHRRRLQALQDGVQEVPGVQHAFAVCPHQSEVVARLVADALTPVFRA